MHKHLKYSKGLHILILFCFLLPFFNTGCEGKTKAEMEEAEKIMAEKIANGDTVLPIVGPDTVVEEDFILPVIDSSASGSNNKDGLLSLKIIEKYPLLKPILTTDEDVYSGLATMIDAYPIITFVGTPIAFLILIICLTAKFFDKNARQTIVILDIIALSSLLIADSLSLDCERLWGIWLTSSLIGILTLYDAYIFRIHRIQLKSESPSP